MSFIFRLQGSFFSLKINIFLLATKYNLTQTD